MLEIKLPKRLIKIMKYFSEHNSQMLLRRMKNTHALKLTYTTQWRAMKKVNNEREETLSFGGSAKSEALRLRS